MFKFSFAALLLLLTVCFSCKDHEVPAQERVYAEFETVPGFEVRNNPITGKKEMLCAIKFKSLGNVPIHDFGIAYSEDSDPISLDWDNIRYHATYEPFTGSASIGEIKQWIPVNHSIWLNYYASFVRFEAYDEFDPTIVLPYYDLRLGKTYRTF